MKNIGNVLAALAILFAGLTATVRAQDPLPSWNDGATKTSITAFVEKVTREGSPDFVPVPERIATFDNDGRINLGFSRKLPPDRRAEFEEENVYMDELGVALCPISPTREAKSSAFKKPCWRALRPIPSQRCADFV